MLVTEVSTKKRNKGAFVASSLIDDLLIEVAQFIKDNDIKPEELRDIVVMDRDNQLPLGTIKYNGAYAVYNSL